MRTYDIIIVGGGITGVATAYELAKKKAGRILLLEKEFVSAGSTGSCAAGIRAQFGTEFNIGLMKRSLEKFERLPEELDYPAEKIELWQGGYLVLAYSQKEWENLKVRVEVQHRLGIMTEILSVDEISRRFPQLRLEGVFGGTFHQKDGHADPLHTTFAYARAARRLNVEIREWTKVDKLVGDERGIRGVVVNGELIEGKKVLVSSGAWSSNLMRTVGVEIPLWGEKHEILITEPLERAFDPMVISFSIGYYIQQRPHGSFIMGIGPENPEHWQDPREFDFSPTWRFLERMSHWATTVLPMLKDVNIVRQWAGLYEMTPDAHHILGPIDEVPGLYIAAGGSGHGFMFGPVVGELMAEWIVGQPLSYDVTRLNYLRFKKGEFVREPAVVG
ncbi:MAG: FAD-binding oxidoreductase [Caldiserica bacterium]|jgi:sarcosine oxidase subunit beta|nr:FAD-binding oxidoreductase [Caldisericota bacterium]MDH7561985.1 FAD-binding oxidoreductase [Caldisericota bacterium]